MPLDELKRAETPVEHAVSRRLGDMPVIWIPVEDEPRPTSLRGFIERNAIALLSNKDRAPLDVPSIGWLGHRSARPLVRSSGLWNQNHVQEQHDPVFLQELERSIRQSNREAVC
jgi:hypothetical protein